MPNFKCGCDIQYVALLYRWHKLYACVQFVLKATVYNIYTIYINIIVEMYSTKKFVTKLLMCVLKVMVAAST